MRANAFEILRRAKHDRSDLARAERLAAVHGHWLAWLTLSTVAFEHGAHDTAAQAIERAIAGAPKQPHARLLAGFIHARAGRREQALRSLELASRLEPTNSQVLVPKLRLLVGLGECPRARQALATVEALTHDAADADAVSELRRAVDGCGAPP